MSRSTLTLVAALLGLGSVGAWVALDRGQDAAHVDPVVSVDTLCDALHAQGQPCHFTSGGAMALEAPAALVDEAVEACAEWVEQGVGCEYIAFPAFEIHPEPIELATAL